MKDLEKFLIALPEIGIADDITAGFELLKNLLDPKHPMGQLLRQHKVPVSAFFGFAATNSTQWLINHAFKPFFELHKKNVQNSKAIKTIKHSQDLR